MKILTDEQYRLCITVAAQLDYGDFHGNRECLEAACENAKTLLKLLGEKTAEEEQEEEEYWQE